MFAFVNGSIVIAPGPLPAPAGTLPGDLLLAILGELTSDATPAGWTRAGNDTGSGDRIACWKEADGSDAITAGAAFGSATMVAYRDAGTPSAVTGDWPQITPLTPVLSLPSLAAAGFVIAGIVIAGFGGGTVTPGSGYNGDYSPAPVGPTLYRWESSTAPLAGSTSPTVNVGSPSGAQWWGQAFTVSGRGGLSMMM